MAVSPVSGELAAGEKREVPDAKEGGKRGRAKKACRFFATGAGTFWAFFLWSFWSTISFRHCLFHDFADVIGGGGREEVTPAPPRGGRGGRG